MFSKRKMTRNQALHPPINAFKLLRQSDCHAQWLQEYFIKPDRLADFLQFLGAELKANEVRLINATIRPTPQDDVSILPYAEVDRYAVVICFAQRKTPEEIAKTKKWIENIHSFLARGNGVFYQAYMPYATRDQFEACYGKERVEQMRRLKKQFDPDCVFGNAHTAKYYDTNEEI
jgi:FAD/FMN-containing dehydrogenase